jgi:hypothetical protein
MTISCMPGSDDSVAAKSWISRPWWPDSQVTRSVSVFCGMRVLLPEAKINRRRALSAGIGVFGSIAVSRSASSVRRGPFAVPLIDQKAGAVA